MELLKQKEKITKIAEKDGEVIYEIPEIHVNDAENYGIKQDSLFAESWTEEQKNLPNSKVLKLMEEQKKEALRLEAAAKASKTKSVVIESDPQKIEINKLLAEGS
ncbi:unnamed protein product [Gongylonema pulchrum]|uniref:DUF4316 domain-containing protein n=1 Tax=Gongylonema pulchrum TaxID=637853 RepID=A0A183D196_9BILA|nr:unnamed protein product [Gongylonema pulchrum]